MAMAKKKKKKKKKKKNKKRKEKKCEQNETREEFEARTSIATIDLTDNAFAVTVLIVDIFVIVNRPQMSAVSSQQFRLLCTKELLFVRLFLCCLLPLIWRKRRIWKFRRLPHNNNKKKANSSMNSHIHFIKEAFK
jgi:hypothetical protein